jgi:hypothetical protein
MPDLAKAAAVWRHERDASEMARRSGLPWSASSATTVIAPQAFVPAYGRASKSWTADNC